MADEKDVGKNAAETEANQVPDSNLDQKVDNSESGEKVKAEEEKKLTQSEVNKIVGGVKVDAYERGRRETEAQYRTEQPAHEVHQKSAAENSHQDDKISLSKSELGQFIRDQSVLQAKESQDIQSANQFMSKMSGGSQKHQDFDELMGEEGLNINDLPMSFINLANSMDNTADMMYELAKNPTKFVSVLALSSTNQKLAYKEFVKLSDSVKRNEEALETAKNSKTNEPLDQVTPSRTGTDDGELKTVSDFKRQPWLRG